jgi:hypothetical protein
MQNESTKAPQRKLFYIVTDPPAASNRCYLYWPGWLGPSRSRDWDEPEYVPLADESLTYMFMLQDVRREK